MNIPTGNTKTPQDWLIYTESLSTASPMAAFTNDQSASGGPWLALLDTGNAAKPVGFTSKPSTESGVKTHIWWMYGAYLEAFMPRTVSFYALRLEEGVDMWQLVWSEDVISSADHIPVTLRSIGPASTTKTHE